MHGPEVACILNGQHLHYRAVHAVDGEILHAPSDAVGFLYSSKTDIRFITAFLDYSPPIILSSGVFIRPGKVKRFAMID
jgi:hypothetical protein